MIYGLEDEEFFKYIEEHPDVPDKLERISDLMRYADILMLRYADWDSLDLLDEKIEVLEMLKEGKDIDEIPNYDKVLTLLPRGENVYWD